MAVHNSQVVNFCVIGHTLAGMFDFPPANAALELVKRFCLDQPSIKGYYYDSWNPANASSQNVGRKYISYPQSKKSLYLNIRLYSIADYCNESYIPSNKDNFLPPTVNLIVVCPAITSTLSILTAIEKSNNPNSSGGRAASMMTAVVLIHHNPPIGNLPIGNPPVGNPPIGNPPIGNLPIGNPPIGNTNIMAKIEEMAIQWKLPVYKVSGSGRNAWTDTSSLFVELALACAMQQADSPITLDAAAWGKNAFIFKRRIMSSSAPPPSAPAAASGWSASSARPLGSSLVPISGGLYAPGAGPFLPGGHSVSSVAPVVAGPVDVGMLIIAKTIAELDIFTKHCSDGVVSRCKEFVIIDFFDLLEQPKRSQIMFREKETFDPILQSRERNAKDAIIFLVSDDNEETNEWIISSVNTLSRCFTSISIAIVFNLNIRPIAALQRLEGALCYKIARPTEVANVFQELGQVILAKKSKQLDFFASNLKLENLPAIPYALLPVRRSGLCAVCYSDPPSLQYCEPCCHLCLCRTCGVHVQKCPICGTIIKELKLVQQQR